MNEIDKELLEKTNGAKLVERRFVAGILQTVLGVMAIICVSPIYVEATHTSALLGSVFTLNELSLFILYDGIYMIRTSRAWPSKGLEIANVVLAIYFLIIFGTRFDFADFSVYFVIIPLYLAFLLIGLPWKNETLKARMKAKKQWLERNK